MVCRVVTRSTPHVLYLKTLSHGPACFFLAFIGLYRVCIPLLERIGAGSALCGFLG